MSRKHRRGGARKVTNLLTRAPDNMSESQKLRYRQIAKKRGAKGVKRFLQRQGLGPLKPKGANNVAQPGVAENVNFTTPQGAVAAGLDVSQELANRNAQMNRPNQTDMYGNTVNWKRGKDGSWNKTTTFGDANQQMLNAEDRYSVQARNTGLNVANQALQNFQTPYSLQGLSQRYGQGDLQGARQAASQAAYNSQMGLLRPEFQQQQKQFEQMAAERGWVPGSKVYENEKNRMMNNQMQQARSIGNQAYNTGLTEMQNMYNISDRERQAQIGEYEKQRYQPLQEAGNLMSQGPGIRAGQFDNYGPIQMQGVNTNQIYGTYTGAQTAQDQMRNQMAIARMNAAAMGAAAGGPAGPSLEDKIRLEQQDMLWQRENGFVPDYRKPPPGMGGGGGGSSNWLGPVVEGIATGIGSGLAKKY